MKLQVVRYCPHCNGDLSRYALAPRETRGPGGGRKQIEIPQKALAEYAKGKDSLATVAVKYGLNASTLHLAVRKAGIKKPKKALLLPDGIGQEYLGGLTVEELRIRYETSAGHITQKLASLGIERRRGKGKQGVRTDLPEILQKYKSGKTLAEIGLAANLTRERVRQIVKQNGLPSRAKVLHEAKLKREKKAARLMADRAGQRVALREKTARLWNQGFTGDEIAEKLGINTHALLGRVMNYRKQYPEQFPLRVNRWTVREPQQEK